MSALRNTHRLRSLIPQEARQRLYEWHPNRARRWRRYPGLERVPDAGHAVLTFDDGPDDDATPEVLDALGTAGVHATFFLLGEQLVRHADLAGEISRRGHEIGVHGYAHERHDRLDAGASYDDVTRGFDAVGQLLGHPPRWYRPPFGKMSDASWSACAELDLSPVYWSAWGHDWEDVAAEQIAQRACGQLAGGGIVLLHDSARYGRRPSAAPTADAIAAIVDHGDAMGLAFTSLGQAAGP
jgi:peptidoglycan-N-acetylglucosamine deacetylase